MSNYRKTKSLCALAGLLFCMAPAAQANWEVSQKLGAGVGYDDNARLDKVGGEQGSESFYGVDAEATFSYATQLTKFEITPVLASKRFLEDSDLNTDDMFLFFDWKREGINADFGFRGNISREAVRTAERLNVDFDIEDPDDIEGDSSGLVISLGDRDRVRLSPEFSYAFSPRYSMRLVGTYQDTSYDQKASRFLSSFQDYSLNASLLYRMSEQDVVLLNAVGSNYETDTLGRDSKGTQFGIGYNRRLSERTSLRFLVGSNSTEDQTGQSQSNPVAEVSLIHRYLLSTVIASYRRSVAGSGNGGQSLYNTFSLNVTRDLTPKLTLNGGARVYTADSLDAVLTDYEYTQLRASLGWRVRRTVTLDLQYAFTHVKRTDGLIIDNEDSNAISLWVYWSPNPLSR